ncbi:hypothetical protein B0H16DRAFT_1481316 [Mycena metata]|uniref:Uncharacterized protein n=1 Tax=Mycena metata TaxID=1033252 RepID=A0AAD7GZH9_9AGAR|nr:hypothetical protein B0H16DRAFT_1481316 [Mycena metata]
MFRLRTMEEMLGWWRRLDKDVAKTVIPEDFPNFSHEDLARTIMLANMFSMDNGLLELKSWTCMFLQVDNWLSESRLYRQTAKLIQWCSWALGSLPEAHLPAPRRAAPVYRNTSKLIRSLALGVWDAIVAKVRFGLYAGINTYCTISLNSPRL